MQTRPYLNLSYGLQSPQNNSGTRSPHMIQETNSALSDDTGVIYGTNISSKTVMSSIERFIQEFETTYISGEETHTEKCYLRQLTDLDLVDTTMFYVQGSHIKEYDRELYYQFIFFPAEMISCFDMTIKLLFEKYFIEPLTEESKIVEKRQKMERLMLGITHLDETTFMRNLTPKDINKLISFQGIVIRCSEIYP